MTGIQRIGICPPIPGHPNCTPQFVCTSNPDIIASVLRIKREAEAQHCRVVAWPWQTPQAQEKRHG